MKKYIFLLAVVLAMGCREEETKKTDTNDLGTWKRLKDFPTEGRASSLSFSINGKGYWAFGGNLTNSFLTEVWEYDPSTDSWQQKKNFPFNNIGEAVAVVNGKAYVLLYSGELYEFDPIADSWTLKSQFPTAEYHNSIGFALGTDAYFGTGNGNTEDESGSFTLTKSFWKYSVTQDTWTQIDDLPGDMRTAAKSFVIGTNAYVGSGYDGPSAPPWHTDFYRYDGKSWHAIADLPENGAIGLVFASKDKGYIGIPVDVGDLNPTVYEYDPAKDTWRKVSRYPNRYALETESFFLNDRLFVVGGWMGSLFTSQVWEFIP